MSCDLDLSADHHLVWLWGAEHNQNFDPAVDVVADHRPVGAVLVHESSDGGICRTAIAFDLPETQQLTSWGRWNVELWFPLTLSPSVTCWCGDHGWIRDGKWVPE